MKPHITKPTIEDACESACIAVGVVYKAVPMDGQFHRADLDGPKNGKNDAGIKFFPDGEGGIVYNWQTGEDMPFFVGDGKPVDEKQRAERDRRRAESMRQHEADERAKHEAAAMRAKTIYDAAKGDPATHPYAIKKNLDLGPSVRRGAWEQRGWTDALIIPLYDATGKPWTLQAIHGNGDKDLLKCGKKAGCFLPFGTIREAVHVLVGEGVATAKAAHDSTGLPCVMGVDSGNLLAVALAVRELAPDAEITLLADNDTKLNEPNTGLIAANKAAAAVSGRVAIPHLDGRKCDWWDVWNELGADAVKDAIDRAQGQEPSKDADHGQQDAARADASWPLPERRPGSITPLGDTDMGNAARLFDANGKNMLYIHEIGWHGWGVNRWVNDEAGVRRIADELPRMVLADAASMLRKAANETDTERRQTLNGCAAALQSWAKKCEKAAIIEAALQMLERRLIIEPTEADADPFLLAVGNGVIDLRTGLFRPPRRGDFITKGSAIAYDPTATCPLFDKFLQRIFRKQPEVIGFLWKAIGYTMTGDTREQCIFILHGTGSNGKSTLVNVMELLLGDYARQAAPGLLLTKTGDRHPTELADLRGARLVATVESGEGRRLAESLVKQLSGGDRIKARLMRKDFFDFWPTHKLWLATNHKPNIKGTDHGIWRRIRLIPFIELITDDEKDPMLPAKLKAELPGIMARAVRGCREWLIDGLNPPEAVTKATADYRAENDMLAAFIEECCVQSTNATAWAGELYTSYKAWCEQTGERYETQKSFGQRLKERGFECVRSTGNRVKYYGIGLIKLDECEKDDGEKPHTGEGATSTTWEDFQ